MEETAHLECIVSSPTETKTYSRLESAVIPAESGAMQVLPGHAESFVLMKNGSLIMKILDGKIVNIPVVGGECHVHDGTITIVQ